MSKKSKYKRLAIIGNGFDIAHGFNTDYRSFVTRTSDESLSCFTEYCDDVDSITTWYLFEENINKLSMHFIEKTFGDDTDYDAVRAEVSHLRAVFHDIHHLLLQYLRNETGIKDVSPLRNVKKYLNRKTKVLTFNYTSTAELYTSNICYVHGSIKENDILLGYDFRDEPCLAEFEDMCWSKTICRESLALRRYLKETKHLSANSPEFSNLLSSLETYQHWENSAQGIDEEDLNQYIPNYRFIHDFLTEYRKKKSIPELNYRKISELVLLGHGIEADQVYLRKILQKCKNLKKVIIFRYRGESDDSFKRKAAFFSPYCKKIITRYYE